MTDLWKLLIQFPVDFFAQLLLIMCKQAVVPELTVLAFLRVVVPAHFGLDGESAALRADILLFWLLFAELRKLGP